MTHSYTVPHVFVGGLPVTTLPLDSIVNDMLRVSRDINRAGERPLLIFSANGHSLSLYATDEAFRHAMDQADMTHADGAIVVAASRFFSGAAIKNRSATTDMLLSSFEAAELAGTTYYFLGGSEEISRRSENYIRQHHPNLKLVGRHNGYFSDAEEHEVVARINAAQPDVLWLGLGKPKEQLFAVRNRDRLKCGWIVSCGGVYNFMVGEYARAPIWMQRMGLEWFHRMLTNPRKLFLRYLTTNPHALWLIVSNQSRRVRG